MKKVFMLFLTFVMVFCITITSFAVTKRKYYVKFMSLDYGNWIWEIIPNVISCQKSEDGLQYIIKYRGIPEPRIQYTNRNNAINDALKERDVVLTIGVDNVIIYEYEE